MKKIFDKKYIASYFHLASEIAKKNKDNILTIQFFQRNNNVVFCGSNFALEILSQEIKNKFEVWSVPEGSIINDCEPAFSIKGRASDILKYEGILDGIFTRLSSIATNCFNVKQITSKPIILMADRNDLFFNQKYDGYAASIGGIKIFCSKGQVELIDSKKYSNEVFSSIPHSLIVNFENNLEELLLAYNKTFPNHKIISLVDFNNDVVNESLLSAKILGKKLYGVRIDTSENNIDVSLNKLPNLNNELNGVNPTLIKKVRESLDNNGFSYVKIIISSGINPDKILLFEKAKAPVDFYGIGKYLTNINIQFTGDAVMVNNTKIAKKGREYRDNPKLVKII